MSKFNDIPVLFLKSPNFNNEIIINVFNIVSDIKIYIFLLYMDNLKNDWQPCLKPCCTCCRFYVKHYLAWQCQFGFDLWVWIFLWYVSPLDLQSEWISLKMTNQLGCIYSFATLSVCLQMPLNNNINCTNFKASDAHLDN